MTRPEPTIFWQLRKLELHCRQKVLGAQPKNVLAGEVATQQQPIYAHLIHNIAEQASEQLVGDLWIGCGGLSFIPYHGLCLDLYIHKGRVKPRILPKTEYTPKKLAIAHINAVRCKKINLKRNSPSRP